MHIRDTHVALSEVATRLQLHHNTLYADAQRSGFGLVREEGQWWLPKEFLERALRERRDAAVEAANSVRARMLAAGGYIGDVETEAAAIYEAVLRGTTLRGGA